MPANRRGATTFLAPATRGLYSLRQLSAWPGAPKVRRCHLIRRRDGRWRQPGGSGAQGGADPADKARSKIYAERAWLPSAGGSSLTRLTPILAARAASS